jgi:AcrR family transcriptional regulator
MTAKKADLNPELGTRDRLARAAVELFQSEGFASTTIDDIAVRAGVGRRTFFRYYRSKEDVIFPDHDRLLAKVRERLYAFPEELAIDAVCHAVRLVLAHYTETRDISLKRYQLVGEVPSLREREIVSVAAYQRLFRERLERDQSHGTMTILKVELIAASVATSHNHVLRHWLRQGGTTDPFAQLDDALNFVRAIFAGSEDHSDSIQSPPSNTTTLVVMAFDESVKNETIAQEIEKIRQSIIPTDEMGPNAKRVRTKRPTALTHPKAPRAR